MTRAGKFPGICRCDLRAGSVGTTCHAHARQLTTLVCTELYTEAMNIHVYTCSTHNVMYVHVNKVKLDATLPAWQMI